MNGNEAINWIHGLIPLGIKPGLKRMEWMLERLDHPERRLSLIHVAGTNGKGSTSAMIASVLMRAGYDVGMFSSPYIETFHDRIRYNGSYISDEDIVTLVKRIRPLVEELKESEWGSPTEFEVITTLALLYFVTVVHPHYVVWETGLGGRLDSTNVVHPLISIITNVGNDHMNILGTRLTDIAAEKAGIIKKGVPVVTSVRVSEALNVIRRVAGENKAPLYVRSEHFEVIRDSYTLQQQQFSFKGPYRDYRSLSIRLMGKHQLENAGTAVMALELLRQFYAVWFEEEDLRLGLAGASWPGRFERFENPGQSVVVLDGAHNPEGAQVLSETLKELYGDRSIHLLFSAFLDKKVDDMLSPLLPLCKSVTVAEMDHPRSEKAENLAERINEMDPMKKVTIHKNGVEALNKLMAHVARDEIILVTGSLYFVSEIRKQCVELFEEAGVNGEYV